MTTNHPHLLLTESGGASAWFADEVPIEGSQSSEKARPGLMTEPMRAANDAGMQTSAVVA